MVGSADKIGMVIGSGSLNFALIGSLLNRACFIYTSPIDLDTYIKYIQGVIARHQLFKNEKSMKIYREAFHITSQKSHLRKFLAKIKGLCRPKKM